MISRAQTNPEKRPTLKRDRRLPKHEKPKHQQIRDSKNNEIVLCGAEKQLGSQIQGLVVFRQSLISRAPRSTLSCCFVTQLYGFGGAPPFVFHGCLCFRGVQRAHVGVCAVARRRGRAAPRGASAQRRPQTSRKMARVGFSFWQGFFA